MAEKRNGKVGKCISNNETADLSNSQMLRETKTAKTSCKFTLILEVVIVK